MIYDNVTNDCDISTNFNYVAMYNLQLAQPGFDFHSYPNDQQVILLRYGVIAYDAAQLQLYPMTVFCSRLADGSCIFSQNPIWTWAEHGTQCTIYYDKLNYLIWPAYTEFFLVVGRQGSGVIVRLILPITILLLLSGLTFWISIENRVDTTITLLLAVSALYIVILQNIPMVGYLTSIDIYVFYVSIILISYSHRLCS
jgi:hypothetical protein